MEFSQSEKSVIDFAEKNMKNDITKTCEELNFFHVFEEPKIKKPLGNPLIPVPQQDALRVRSARKSRSHI